MLSFATFVCLFFPLSAATVVASAMHWAAGIVAPAARAMTPRRTTTAAHVGATHRATGLTAPTD